MERKHQIDNTATLMSPPEPLRLDNFSNTSPTMAPKFKAPYSITNATFPMSPPVSPETRSGPPDVPTLQITDPILYPNQDANPSSSQPLFDSDLSVEAQRVVDGHVAAREASMFRESSPPRTSEYELALEFKSQVAKSFNNNRRLWFRRELAYLLEDKELQSGGRRYHTIAPAVRGGRDTVRPPTKNNVKKPPGSGPRGVSKPQPRQSTPNPEGKRVAREDKDFELLPDYCPPITSLPNKPNSLKVDWKGAPIDLRFDPHVTLLHPDEVSLAANLRLDCATYLTSKRRIFIKRIEALRIGKEFRKTDAQQACKIDVNKASKLWQAFEKVGWLNPSWVRKYA